MNSIKTFFYHFLGIDCSPFSRALERPCDHFSVARRNRNGKRVNWDQVQIEHSVGNVHFSHRCIEWDPVNSIWFHSKIYQLCEDARFKSKKFTLLSISRVKCTCISDTQTHIKSNISSYDLIDKTTCNATCVCVSEPLNVSFGGHEIDI